MATFNYIHNHLSTSSFEDYLLNASFLLGNQCHQNQFPDAYDASCDGSSINSCIDDFDYTNPLLSTDMLNPVSTIVYDDGVSFLSSYPMVNNKMMSYHFLSTPALTFCSGLCNEPSVKVDYDEVSYFSSSQQQLQPQDVPLYEENYFGQPQQYPNSPESMYSTDFHHATIKLEASVAGDQLSQKKSQSKPKVPKKPSASTTSAEFTATTTPRPKIFACTHCNRKFARKYDAARHKRIHTGVKPYYCPCCNKGFARSDARVRHFRTEYNCRDGADKIQQNRQRHHNERCTAPRSDNLCHS
ncbi:unnamed protein product [Mucor fragilis]